eukprot:2791511-Pleurochrysis_carterae.AAC.5
MYHFGGCGLRCLSNFTARSRRPRCLVQQLYYAQFLRSPSVYLDSGSVLLRSSAHAERGADADGRESGAKGADAVILVPPNCLVGANTVGSGIESAPAMCMNMLGLSGARVRHLKHVQSGGHEQE